MSRIGCIAAAVAALVALESAPAGAALTHNALAPEGSALADLNGVAVEAVTLADGALPSQDNYATSELAVDPLDRIYRRDRADRSRQVAAGWGGENQPY